MLKRKHHAIIIGAGATGLTTAHLLLKFTEIRPIVLEREKFVGGRNFFADEQTLTIWREIFTDIDAPQAAIKIFFDGKFFDCPVTASWSTFNRFGLATALAMGASFLRAKIFRREELTPEDRLINRVGKKFFDTVLRDCGAENFGDEKIFCPDGGTRHIWENFAEDIKRRGGEVLTDTDVKNFRVVDNVVKSAQVESPAGTLNFPADYFFAPVTKSAVQVELVAENIFAETPCKIYVNEPTVKLARVEIFGKQIRAEFFGDGVSAREIDELAAMLAGSGIVNAADVQSSAVVENLLPIVDGAPKNFFAVDTNTAIDAIKSIEGLHND